MTPRPLRSSAAQSINVQSQSTAYISVHLETVRAFRLDIKFVLPWIEERVRDGKDICLLYRLSQAGLDSPDYSMR